MNDISLGATDGYMWTQNKIGICAELGSSDDYEKYIDLGIDTVKKFLKQFNMIEEEITTNTIDTEILQAYSLHKRRNEQFSFMKEFKTFDVIEKGELFGKDGDSELITDRESYILFPRPNNKVGIEAFALAEKR
jgi:succinylglutamate desuccinylase